MNSRNLREYALAATRQLVEYGAMLDECNADKAAISAWYQAMSESLEGEDAR